MPPGALPSIDAEVCIIGAGPHGLAAATHLLCADPTMSERLVVLDPAGAWLSVWREHFARLEIDHLRSPIVHHPASDVSALARHVNANRLTRSGLPYELPMIEAFTSFCDRLATDSGVGTPRRARTRRITPVRGRLHIQTKEEDIAVDRVIVASNPHRRVLPDWVGALLGRCPQLTHADDVDLRSLGRLDGEQIAIVGGGLTAAHLACGAAARGARVDLIARRPLVVRSFDTDPGWLGPRLLRDYGELSDPRVRLAAARAARGGGSIPPWMHARLTDLASGDGVTVREAVTVLDAAPGRDGRGRLRLQGGVDVEADRIWLATGTVPDINSLRCLRDLVVDMGLVDGIPVTDEALRAGPHRVHVMGRLATIELGPAAGNLWGAQRAACRITRAITGVDLDPGSTAFLPIDEQSPVDQE